MAWYHGKAPSDAPPHTHVVERVQDIKTREMKAIAYWDLDEYEKVIPIVSMRTVHADLMRSDGAILFQNDKAMI